MGSSTVKILMFGLNGFVCHACSVRVLFQFYQFLFQSASGPGLTFIAFTEAITMMPASPIWSVLFFCMLLTLGLGSMFGTLEGVITPFYDMKIVPFRKEIMTGKPCWKICMLRQRTLVWHQTGTIFRPEILLQLQSESNV